MRSVLLPCEQLTELLERGDTQHSLVYRALPRTERSLVSGDRPDRFRAPLGGSRRSLTRRVMALCALTGHSALDSRTSAQRQSKPFERAILDRGSRHLKSWRDIHIRCISSCEQVAGGQGGKLPAGARYR
jgi:hypothetical protein